MSMSTRNSTSDEESITDFRTQIQLPTLDLAAVRRQNQRHEQTPKSNIARATQNFANKIKQKPSKFADSYTPRNPREAINSSSNMSDSDDDADSVDPNLPEFTFDPNTISVALQGDEEEEEEEVDDEDETGDNRTDPFNPPQQFYTDSSDDEGSISQSPSRQRRDSNPFIRKIKSAVEDSSPKGIKHMLRRMSHVETHDSDSTHESVHSGGSGFKNMIRRMSTRESRDSPSRLTEEGNSRSRHRRLSDLEHSHDATEDTKHGTFRGILRKMSTTLMPGDSLDDLQQDLSTSDTFIGRVLSMGNEGGTVGTLSGGGLVPGASRIIRDPRNNDEERRVGFAPDAIEMRPMKYDHLSLEARELIDQHIPDAKAQSRKSVAHPHIDDIKEEDEEDERESEETAEEEGNNLQRKKSIHNSKTDERFLAPNPDLFLRREGTRAFDPPDDFLQDYDGEHFEPPKRVHAGVLSSLLQLYQNQEEASKSQSSFSTFAESSATTSENLEPSSSNIDFSKFKPYTNESPLGTSSDEENDDKDKNSQMPSFQNARPRAPKKVTEPVSKLKRQLKHNKRREDRIRITVHIADILQRQRFIMKMCRALMLFGAPTHRLEEYMIMTSRVLEIDGQFIYFPGCMLVSFGDAATRTSEVHLVRCAQGLNLSKLAQTHRIYKAVIHDLIGVEDAGAKLDELVSSRNLYPPWLCVLFYGLGSVAVTPFAFEGGWIDLPISFGVGLCVGFLQFYVSSISHLYSSVFEVSASIVVAFISRGIGSINNGSTFCFSAICQGSLALILPGYIILCGSLELQSRNLVAGSVRMFYAIIYSLLLGFGITLGAALYGWVDKTAVSDNSCRAGHAMDDKFRILFVPMFALCLGLINQSHWKQLPAMVVIAGVGYIGTYFAGKHFSQVTEFTSCIGAFIIGILGNLYSRLGRGMAVSAMLPAIFVQVPSGIASKSSLITGIINADQITKHNGTVADVSSASSLSFGATMVEVSIGISVGLFAAALVVYPLGKRRTGLFSL